MIFQKRSLLCNDMNSAFCFVFRRWCQSLFLLVPSNSDSKTPRANVIGIVSGVERGKLYWQKDIDFATLQGFQACGGGAPSCKCRFFISLYAETFLSSDLLQNPCRVRVIRRVREQQTNTKDTEASVAPFLSPPHIQEAFFHSSCINAYHLHPRASSPFKKRRRAQPSPGRRIRSRKYPSPSQPSFSRDLSSRKITVHFIRYYFISFRQGNPFFYHNNFQRRVDRQIQNATYFPRLCMRTNMK